MSQQFLYTPLLASSSTTSSAQYVVEGETTTVKVPMLRPRPALLKVLHLGGGVGETFTMGEIIHHVKQYIGERVLYDEQDPRVVRCAGDLLAEALGVDIFTVHEAIGLFHKNCTMEPDSCIRIHRHVTRAEPDSCIRFHRHVTRAVSSQLLPATTGVTCTTTRSEVTVATPPAPPVASSSAAAQHNIEGVMNPSYDGGLLASQSRAAQKMPQSSYRLPKSSSSLSFQQSSSSSSAIIKINTAESSLTTTDIERPYHGQQVFLSSDSSSSEGMINRFRGYYRQTESDNSNIPTRTRSTSVNVTYDEPDGATDPWTCEVMMETLTRETTKPEDDTVVVEFDSDTFSVEYDIDTGSETDVREEKTTKEACLESDESSSASRTAILVVCKESDVEYLADYSDSNTESDTELSNADKWQCEQCLEKNPPFQRNCGGCWSVRPDWLPSSGKETGDGVNTDTLSTVCLSSNVSESSQPQSEEFAKDSVNPNQDCDHHKQKITTVFHKGKKNSKSSHEKRKHSSSLSTSDSQDGKIKEETGRLQDNSQMSLSGGQKKALCRWTTKDDPCVVCLTRRKTASIIHGKSGHQVCCYRCAKRLKKERKSCPICRRPIQKVIRNFHL